MRTRLWRIGMAAVLAGVGAIAAAVPAFAGSPVGAPFTAPAVNATTSWCPNFHADSPATCSTDNQTQTFEVQPYHHANVQTSNNGYINLTLDATNGAAVNTQGQTSFNIPGTIGGTLNIDCTNAGVPRGWMAYWTDSLPGASGGGEFDIYETLDQTAKWGMHVGSIALPASGNAYPNPCGSHSYKVIIDSTKAAYYEDGVWQGKVLATDVTSRGGTWPTAPQRIIGDYGSCTQSWCNPTNNFYPSTDQITSQWYTAG
jgi:hypothetical protein